MAYLMIGLDRGSCEVKAVVLEKSFRGYEVKGTRMVRVPQDGAAPPTGEAIEAAVAGIVEEFDPGAVGYVTDFPGRKASTWFVELPFTDQRRIDQTLPFELENYVPFDLDDMVLDYRVIRSESGRSRVLAALAPRGEVGSTLQALKKLKVDPRAIILDGDALAHVPPGKNADKTLAIVDIGHTQTIVTIRSGGQTDFIRAIPRGGLQVTQAVMRAFGVNYRTAEAMKIRLEPVSPIPDDEVPSGAGASGGDTGEAEGAPPSSGNEGGSGAEPGMSVKQVGEVVADRVGDDRPGRSQVDPMSASLRRSEEGEAAPDSLDSSPEMQVFTTLKALGDEVGDEENEPTVRVEPEGAGWTTVDDGEGDRVPEGPADQPLEDAGRTQTSATGTLPPTRRRIREVVEEAMQPILREIRGALIGYEGSEHRDVDAMLLVGGGALFDGLPSAFEETLGIPVGRPARLGPDQTTLVPEDALCRYAKAFSLAYIGATDTRQGAIDFRKGDFSYQKSYQALRRYLFVAVALALIGIVVATSMFVTEVQRLRRESRELDARIGDAIKAGFPDIDVDVSRGVEMAIAKMREEYATMEARGKRLGLGDTRRTSIDLLREISAVVPGSDEIKVDVDDFSFEGNQVKLRGTADKFESIDKIEKAIQSSDMVLETKSDVGSKGEKKNFNLVITLREPGEESAY